MFLLGTCCRERFPFGCYHIRVPTARLVTLIAVFFFTSVLSVVTGSTFLITVPVMIAFEVEAHVAIATNMLALTFMSVGGSLPFMGKGVLNRSRLPFSVVLTIVGSGLGALLVLTVPVRALQIVIACAMIAVAIVSLLNKNLWEWRRTMFQHSEGPRSSGTPSLFS